MLSLTNLHILWGAKQKLHHIKMIIEKTYYVLKYNILVKILKYIYFISFYKVEDCSIFVKTNSMYLCTQKHKYISKDI
jgi:hypothetical protein